MFFHRAGLGSEAPQFTSWTIRDARIPIFTHLSYKKRTAFNVPFEALKLSSQGLKPLWQSRATRFFHKTLQKYLDFNHLDLKTDSFRNSSCKSRGV